MSVNPAAETKQKGKKKKQSSNLREIEIEISPYIRSVMAGASPRYLEDEMKALKIAEQLGWEAQKDGSPAIKPGSRM